MIFGQISKKNKERCKQKSTVLGVIWFLRIFTVAVMLYIVYGIIQGKAFGLAGWTSIPFVYLRYSPRRWLAYHMVTLIPAAIMFLCLCIRKRTCYYAVLGFCYAEIIAALGKMYKSYSGYQFTYLLTNPTQRAQWDSKGGYWGLAGEIFAIWVALFVLFLIVQYFWRKTPVFAYYARSENTDVRPKKTMLKSLCLMFLITFIGGETMGIPSHKSNNAKYNIVDAENKIFVHTFPTQPYINNESIMDIYGPDTDLKVLEIDNIYHNENYYMKVGLRVLQIKDDKKNKLFSIKDTGGIASGKFANEGKNLLLSVKPQGNTDINFREINMEDNREIDEWPGFSPSNISRTEANFIAFSPDKKKFIAAAPAKIAGREGWSIDVWDYEKKKLLATEKVISSVYYFLAWTNNQEYASWQGYEGKEGIVFTKVNEAGVIEKTYNEAMSKIVIEKATTGDDTKIKLSIQPYTKDIILIVNNFSDDYSDSVSGWDAATKEKTFMFDKKGIGIIHAFFPNATEMILLVRGHLLENEKIIHYSSLAISVNTANGEIKRFKNIIGKPESFQWSTTNISRSRQQGDKPDNKISKKYKIYAPLDQVIAMTTYCADISASKIFLCDGESGILNIKDFGVRIGEKK